MFFFLSNLHSYSFHRRTQHRSQVRLLAEEEFARKAGNYMVIHWDGKLMDDTTDKDNNKKVDRLAVVATGQGISKILGIPKLSNGTGEAQASGVFNLLTKWNLADVIIGMSFDTTSSNTGIHRGAAILLEQQIGRKLLFLACRHHIHELIVQATFEALFGQSTSPEVSVFVEFRRTWYSLERKACQPLKDARLSRPFVRKTKTEVTTFMYKLVNQEDGFLRDDYEELCQLCLLVLGEKFTYKYRAPGKKQKLKIIGNYLITILRFKGLVITPGGWRRLFIYSRCICCKKN
jgi:hypothetical protein